MNIQPHILSIMSAIETEFISEQIKDYRSGAC